MISDISDIHHVSIDGIRYTGHTGQGWACSAVIMMTCLLRIVLDDPYCDSRTRRQGACYQYSTYSDDLSMILMIRHAKERACAIPKTLYEKISKLYWTGLSN